MGLTIYASSSTYINPKKWASYLAYWITSLSPSPFKNNVLEAKEISNPEMSKSISKISRSREYLEDGNFKILEL
jgi:hypothetical protein